MGRFGPFVQIGTKDDEDKPKFAGLRPGQKMDLITFAEAIELFKLPRKLGATADGQEITTNVGRFGPYVKYGPKYVSLKTDDPYEITPERALEVIKEKEIADANRLILDFPEAKIQVLNGRYGPYITDKERNAKIPKDKDPKSLTLEECQALLAAAPVRTFGKWGKKNARTAPAKAAAKSSAPAASDRAPARKKATAAAAANGAGGAGITRGAGGANGTNGRNGGANGAAGARATAASATGAPVKLAARASKTAANKKAPLQAAAHPGAKTAERESPVTRPGAAGHKSAVRKKP
jgi:DNA topoisomerase-1